MARDPIWGDLKPPGVSEVEDEDDVDALLDEAGIEDVNDQETVDDSDEPLGLRILTYLGENGGSTVPELSRALDAPRENVRSALNTLENREQVARDGTAPTGGRPTTRFVRREPGDDAKPGWVDKRKCEGCDEEFAPSDPRQVFCSIRCQERKSAGRARPRNFEPRVCALDGCDEEFEPKAPRQKYHSDECRDEAARRQRRDAKRERAKGEEPPEQEWPHTVPSTRTDSTTKPDTKSETKSETPRVDQGSAPEGDVVSQRVAAAVDRLLESNDDILSRLAVLEEGQPAPRVDQGGVPMRLDTKYSSNGIDHQALLHGLIALGRMTGGG